MAPADRSVRSPSAIMDAISRGDWRLSNAMYLRSTYTLWDLIMGSVMYALHGAHTLPVAACLAGQKRVTRWEDLISCEPHPTPHPWAPPVPLQVSIKLVSVCPHDNHQSDRVASMAGSSPSSWPPDVLILVFAYLVSFPRCRPAVLDSAQPQHRVCVSPEALCRARRSFCKLAW